MTELNAESLLGMVEGSDELPLMSDRTLMLLATFAYVCVGLVEDDYDFRNRLADVADRLGDEVQQRRELRMSLGLPLGDLD